MSKEKEFAKNTLIIAVGNICTRLITFMLLPLYTALLTTSEFGIVDLLNTLISLLAPIITFQIEQAAFRFLVKNRNDDEKIQEIISSSFFLTLLQVLLYCSIFVVISRFINFEYKYLFALNVIIFIFNMLFLQYARGLGDNKKYALGSFLSALFTIILNVILLVVFKMKVNGMLIGTCFGQLIGVIYLMISLKLLSKIKYKKCKNATNKLMLKYSIPLIPNAVSWWIFNSSDRLIVSIVLGMSYTGILSASYKFSSAYIIIYNMFNMSWTESIALNIDSKDIKDYFNNMFNVLLKFFSAFAIGIIAIMPFVWPIMVNKSFNDGYVLVPILMVASIFNVIVGLTSAIYLAKNSTKALANTSIVSAIINISVHLALIKFVGLYAAALSTFASFFIMSIYRISDINKKYFRINIDKNFILISSFVLMIIMSSYYINIFYVNIIGVLIASVYIFVINKETMSIIMNFLKKKIKK